MMPRGEKRQCLVVQNSLSEVREENGKMIYYPSSILLRILKEFTKEKTL